MDIEQTLNLNLSGIVTTPKPSELEPKNVDSINVVRLI